jgi:hypothetical protein
MPSLTQNELKDWLRYDPETGSFFWLKINSNRVAVGEKAGTVRFDGYTIITLQRRQYRAHHLAWLYVYGEFPSSDHLDHINGNRGDNRIKNLRLADHGENLMNRGRQRNNKAGYKGIWWDKEKQLWAAMIGFNNQKKALGRYSTAEEAARAYDKAAREHHGPFAYQNFKEEQYA